jgi:hypothetical protein
METENLVQTTWYDAQYTFDPKGLVLPVTFDKKNNLVFINGRMLTLTTCEALGFIPYGDKSTEIYPFIRVINTPGTYKLLSYNIYKSGEVHVDARLQVNYSSNLTLSYLVDKKFIKID